jgi:UDP-N-acetylglucosamine 2-epimerase (non-hydrolysing)
MILLTTHRRENFGEPLQQICGAVLDLIQRFPDICVVLPVHPNPNVKNTVETAFKGIDRIHLIAPQDYEPFCRLMERATLILTDSGGVQEEAPSLKKPVLVLRDETERPEAVALGVVKLVGPHRERIVEEASCLLGDTKAYNAMARHENPYGDGLSSGRIIEVLKNKL